MFQTSAAARGLAHVFPSVPSRGASTRAPQSLHTMSCIARLLRDTIIFSMSTTCLANVCRSDRLRPWHLPHPDGRRCSSGLFVSSLRAAPGRPTARPGGRRSGCRACSAPIAFFRRYSAVHVPVRGGEWGLLWHESLAASLLLSPARAALSASSLLTLVALADLGGVDGLPPFDLGGVPRLILLQLGLQLLYPAVRRGQPLVLFAQLFAQALVPGDSPHELFAHDDQVRPCQDGAAPRAPIRPLRPVRRRRSGRPAGPAAPPQPAQACRRPGRSRRAARPKGAAGRFRRGPPMRGLPGSAAPVTPAPARGAPKHSPRARRAGVRGRLAAGQAVGHVPAAVDGARRAAVPTLRDPLGDPEARRGDQGAYSVEARRAGLFEAPRRPAGDPAVRAAAAGAAPAPPRRAVPSDMPDSKSVIFCSPARPVIGAPPSGAAGRTAGRCGGPVVPSIIRCRPMRRGAVPSHMCAGPERAGRLHRAAPYAPRPSTRASMRRWNSGSSNRLA